MRIAIFIALIAFCAPAVAGCVVSGDLNWNDPCSQTKKKPKQNSFGDFNTPNSRMSEADMERDRKKELDRQTILEMERQVEANKRAEQAAIARQQQEREREIALRQQEIAAKNRQAELQEARIRLLEQQAAQQRQTGSKPLDCFSFGGGFSTCK